MKVLLGFILLIVGLGLFAWWYILSRLRHFFRTTTSAQTKDSDMNHPQNMLECAYCGLHIPEQEAHQSGGKVYCCTKHLKAAHKIH